MKYLSTADLIAINQELIRRAGEGQAGVQYPQGLELVVVQPTQAVFGRELYPTIWLKAAFILQKITKKHVFVDGNKRTALSATTVFLNLNGYKLVHSDEEGKKLILSVTNAKDTEEVMLTVAEWLKAHSKPFNTK
ncbi:MAG: type II toxin-antitoxin system death-on-curing family toxin [Schleiferilactobacillus harbinensis]|jgi:death-on-curing protein|nr:type II toxin-antitoxin system death-on-curing family toxin [Schleiferilactobacillus harbinensis]MCI1912180.1 type II toxin-antitoxin system death-on-curing family toxin [Schleiferilactobacillus harbinensis]